MADGYCAGGVCGAGSSPYSWYGLGQGNWWQNLTQFYPQPTTPWDKDALVAQEGGVANFMQNRPEVFNPRYAWYDDPRYTMPSDVRSMAANVFGVGGGDMGAKYRQEIQDWENIKSQITGITGTYIRALIDNKIANINYQWKTQMHASSALMAARARKLKETVSGIEPSGMRFEEVPGGVNVSYEESTISPEARAKIMALNTAGGGTALRPKELSMPIPDWMKPFVASPVVQAMEQEVRGRRGVQRTQPTLGISPESGLKPLSAQTDLTPEQMGLMAGYEAWRRAGAPKTLRSVEQVAELANWQPWWEQYTKLSQSLFPTQVKLGQRKATVKQ